MSSAFGTVVPSSGFSFFSNGNNSGTQHNVTSKNASGKDRPKRQQDSRKKFVDSRTSTKDQPKNQRRAPKKKGKRLLRETKDDKRIFAAGPLLNSFSPEQLGFQRLSHKPREMPKYLIQQTPQLKRKMFKQDPWDLENQKKMTQLENTISDVTTLWETLRKMREVERKVMEDKKLVDKADHAKDLNEAITFQGTCLDMCPIFERVRRSVENNVVGYEKDDPNSQRISRSKALKVFARPAAAAAPPLPSDVRPPHILQKTLDYIVENIIQQLPDCESFLWDRMRSIRQDFTYQNYFGPEAIDCNERIVRIHLLILHIMAKSDVEYSRQQELEQLHKALITLSEIYDEVRLNGGFCPNEAEFRAYSLLSRIRDPEYDKMIQDLPENIFRDDKVQLAICFRRIISNSNYSERGYIRTENCMNLYARFFQLIQSPEIPFLMSSFLEVYVNEVRFYAVKSLSHSINRKHKPIPMSYLEQTLLFNNDEEIRNFCKYYSIDINGDGVLLTSLEHHSHILPDTKPLKQSYLLCVDGKLQMTSLVQLINSGSSNDIASPLLESKTSLPAAAVSESHALILSNSELSNTPTPTPPAFEFVTGTGYDTNKNDQTHGKTVSDTPFSFLNNFKESTDKAHIVEAKRKNEMKENNKNLNLNENQNKNNKESEKIPAQTFTNNAEIKRQIQEQKVLQDKVKQEQIERLKFENKKLALQTQIKNEDKKLEHQVVGFVAEKIIRETVNQCVTKCVDERICAEKERKNKIEGLSKELYRAFIHEKLYFIYLDVKAVNYDKLRILRHNFKHWKESAASKQKEKAVKRRRMEEITQVGKQLGVPLIKRSRIETDNSNLADNFSFSLPCTSDSPLIYTPTQNEESHFTNSMRKNSDIWRPIDLKKSFLDLISANYDLERKDSSFRSIDLNDLQNSNEEIVDIFIYSRNWNCISGNWLLNKFGLYENPEKHLTLSNEIISVNVYPLGNEFKPSKFENLQLLVFNSGVTENDIFDLDLKLKQDGEKLIELVHGAALNTNFKFSVLIVYWESAENPLSTDEIVKFLKINKIAKIFSTVINDIEIVKMASNDPHQTLVNGVSKIASTFKFELTERGIYYWSLRKRNLSASLSAAYQPTKNIDEKMHNALQLEMEKYRQEKDQNNTYAHLRSHVAASPRSRRRKLPVLLSDSHNSKFKTPLALRPHMRKGSSYSVPSAPSHLATKFDHHEHIAPRLVSMATPSHPRRLTVDCPAIQSTPPIASISSRRAANTSGISNVTFGSPFSTPSNKMPARPEGVINDILQAPSAEESSMEESSGKFVPDSVLELKDLIASVKKKLNKH
ncbi:LAFE_0H07668g1_1 [Lachancea fermentati]|uniref:Nuclear mRNA export factor n=1 Tax=Lachancea fermentati TaxID=4955 RepID=A0A1G4MJX0_LACFM|nr:LAFE_0H07668g1_1 [Lachancea fermentati]